MKKLFSIIAIISCMHAAGQVQIGGVIRAQNNSGVIDNIKRNADALKVSDSIAAAKLDSNIISRKQVQVSNFPAVQTVTGSLVTTVDSTKERIYHKVDVLNFPATQPVSGTFWQATQPVSGTVGISGTVPVSGTFWQATQPVSGTVNAAQSGTWTVQPGNTANTTAWKVDGSAVTQPVSGTFWQATQPVSGTVSANASQTGTWTVQPGNTANTTAWKVDGSAVTQPVSGTVGISGTVPVSGTFWQATQPVSGTVTANAGSGTFNIQSNASVNVAQMNGVTTTMGNGIAGTGVQRVAIASDNTAFSVNAAATQSGTWTVQPGNTANTTAWKVDGSAVTQPVSGTVTANAGSGTFNIQSNASVNNAQVNGVTITTGNGIAGTGVQRVAIASDNTAFSVNAAQSGTWTVQPGNTANTTAWKVDGSAVTQPVSGTVTANAGSGTFNIQSNASVNVAQMNGVATTMGNGIAGTGVQRVAIASDNTAFSVNAAATQTGTWTVQPGNTANTTAWKVDGSAVTQPVSGTVSANASQTGTWTVQPGNTANTTAWKVDGSAVTQPTNQTQINGVTVNTGTGVQGTGVQRITLASDQAAISTAGVFSVKIDQTTPGTTNAVAETHLPATAASADALANPTITQIGADQMLYNGSTWDRQRGMSVATTTGDAGAKTATGNGATQTNVGNKGIQIFIDLGTVSGTSPTCVFKVQGSVDGGTLWFDIPAAATASLTSSVDVGIMLYPGVAVLAGSTTTGTTATCSEVLPRTWRMVWTIGGTTPSFTINSVTYNYLSN
jgi:hypothetical protein